MEELFSLVHPNCRSETCTKEIKLGSVVNVFLTLLKHLKRKYILEVKQTVKMNIILLFLCLNDPLVTTFSRAVCLKTVYFVSIGVHVHNTILLRCYPSVDSNYNLWDL